MVLAGAAAIAWWLTGGRASTASRTSAGPTATLGTLSAVARAQAQAAAWIAGQVSDSAIIACDPGLCPVLQEQGITPGRLMPLRAAASPLGADVLVTSGSAGGPLAARYGRP